MNQKRNSLILIAVLLIVAAISGWYYYQSTRKDYGFARVTVYGVEYGIYDLSKNQTIEFKNAFDENTIVIENGQIQVTYSNCANQICVHEYPISMEYIGVICCLPHGLIIELVEK